MLFIKLAHLWYKYGIIQLLQLHSHFHLFHLNFIPLFIIYFVWHKDISRHFHSENVIFHLLWFGYLLWWWLLIVCCSISPTVVNKDGVFVSISISFFLCVESFFLFYFLIFSFFLVILFWKQWYRWLMELLQAFLL